MAPPKIGSLGERRFALCAGGMFHGFGIVGSVSRLDFNEPVVNSDYENTNTFLSAIRKWGGQSLSLRGNYDFNNTGAYLHRHRSRQPQPQVASFFLNNSPDQSPFGISLNKDIHATRRCPLLHHRSRLHVRARGRQEHLHRRCEFAQEAGKDRQHGCGCQAAPAARPCIARRVIFSQSLLGGNLSEWRTARWISVAGNYTYLDIEPTFGASAGFHRNPGYQNIGLNLNYRAGHGVTLYGNLRNALNQRYEEIYGFPSPILNFVAGVKWSMRAR
jgi:hypothetical protein